MYDELDLSTAMDEMPLGVDPLTDILTTLVVDGPDGTEIAIPESSLEEEYLNKLANDAHADKYEKSLVLIAGKIAAAISGDDGVPDYPTTFDDELLKLIDRV